LLGWNVSNKSWLS